MLLLARYVLPISSVHIENGAVLVQDGKIEAVGEAAELTRLYPDEEIRDFGVAALMPGFVDAHTHLEYTILRGLINDLPYVDWKFALVEKEKLFTQEDWEDSALLGALDAGRSGITTVADITESGASFRALKTVGLRGIVYREVGTMERSEVDSVLDAAYADIAQWRAEAGEGFQRIGIAPSPLYSCHPLVFQHIADFAQDGTPVAVHLAGSREEYEFIRYGSSPFSVPSVEERGYGIDMPPWLATGVSPVRYILNWGVLDAPNVLAIHCVHVDDDDISKLVDRDVAIAICSRCNAQLGMGVAPLSKMLKAGLRIGLGTDSPAATDTTDPIAEMRLGLLIQRSLGTGEDFLSAAQFVRLATLDAAEALDIEDYVGSLEVGKLADIIAIDLSSSNQVPTLDPASAIVNTTTKEDVIMTMVQGKILYDRGKHVPAIDWSRLAARAHEMRLKLLG
ncbi:MAG: amidohydrolase family protein [Coriobacteriales bacterium]|jgi:5-methylthioadenosine/S-adenosylhomocysteine deaminase|nr:amidohydrolase family protein [Coriobacteriales bacterium]